MTKKIVGITSQVSAGAGLLVIALGANAGDHAAIAAGVMLCAPFSVLTMHIVSVARTRIR